jgi:hypothetical protein
MFLTERIFHSIGTLQLVVELMPFCGRETNSRTSVEVKVEMGGMTRTRR